MRPFPSIEFAINIRDIKIIKVIYMNDSANFLLNQYFEELRINLMKFGQINYFKKYKKVHCTVHHF